MLPFSIALAVLLGGTGAPQKASAADELVSYVAKVDDSYAWAPRARYQEDEIEVLELRLQSQTWQETLWKHQLYKRGGAHNGVQDNARQQAA